MLANLRNSGFLRAPACAHRAYAKFSGIEPTLGICLFERSYRSDTTIVVSEQFEPLFCGARHEYAREYLLHFALARIRRKLVGNQIRASYLPTEGAPEFFFQSSYYKPLTVLGAI